jgi:hypothetical protein
LGWVSPPARPPELTVTRCQRRRQLESERTVGKKKQKKTYSTYRF